MKILLDHTDFTLIDKPTGVSCHNEKPTVEELFSEKVYFVNRLDKDTSGIMMLTKNPSLQNDLNLALKAGEKNYICVLRGTLAPGESWLTWDLPISDKAEGRKYPQGKLTDQVEALTLYRVLKSNSYFSLTECQIKTGRQHQIRKHSALFQKPIVGDLRYGNEKDNQRIAKLYSFNRLALHSWKLRFHWKNEEFYFETEIPADFEYLFKH